MPVAEPALVGNEIAYVNEALSSTWISSSGKYIEQFEQKFADFCGTSHAISCCNGTAALHIALLALDVGSGDEVIVPTLTFVATANAVSYCGATPIFVDSEPTTWNMDPAAIEALITPRTKGIIAVHLFGHPADMDPIMEIAARYNLFVVEDAAEAHGAEYKGRRVGSIGHIGTFSFFGNKIITSGEGGMTVTNDANLASRMRQLKGQGQDFKRRYWFPIIGYNYRMTNIQAAIGLAQMERVDWHIAQRCANAQLYRDNLGNHLSFVLQPELPGCKNVYWMNSIVFNENFPYNRDTAMEKLSQQGIETRPFFYPMHILPPYQHLSNKRVFPVAETVAARGINIPSSALLTEREIKYVAETLSCLANGDE
ncbi:aminotransferase DegT [Candidatus Chloroploca asiatica]|uniref:Aminotransferase DegT n=1 Tax=Candidatus Chloroploca asiatica TaxID=1506545 RepID=A0A2H3KM47_9CHLR|nr:aminotransferase DegT [Candidatus Chloroploca asiatica]